MTTMATTINHHTLVPSPNPRLLLQFTECYSVNPLALTRFCSRASSTIPRTLSVKCNNNNISSSANEGGVGGLKEALTGIVDERVDELLNREENRGLLDGLEKAAQRVDIAKRDLADIQRQEIEAKQMRDYINHLESRASEIAECQKDISDARKMVEEAERALSIDDAGNRNVLMDGESEEVDKNADRLESIKAGAIAAVIGTLAGLPISFTQVTTISQLILPTATTFISCALFGVTYRYAVRRDLDDFHLKSGTCAAFGFVKGLATLDGGPPLELGTGSLHSHAFNGAVYVSENVLIFLFAAVGLDLCYKMRLLSPFPSRKANTK